MTASGFTEHGLERLNERMRECVDRGEAPGIVTALQRNGEPIINVVGVQDIDA